HFQQPDTGKELAGELDDLGSPVGAFVRERCIIGPAVQIERSALFAAWKSYCESQGREHPGDAATFGRNLRAVLPALKSAYPRSAAVQPVKPPPPVIPTADQAAAMHRLAELRQMVDSLTKDAAWRDAWNRRHQSADGWRSPIRVTGDILAGFEAAILTGELAS